VLDNHFEYFHLRFDATGRRELMPLTKYTAAMQTLAYGITVDCVDDYLISASTALGCVKKFCLTITQVFGGRVHKKTK